MTELVIGFAIGFIIGACFGVVIFAALAAGKRNHE